jgi:hypothetical protein
MPADYEMEMRIPRLVIRLAKFIFLAFWWIFGIWTACAVLYTAPVPNWLNWIFAIGVVALVVVTVRDWRKLFSSQEVTRGVCLRPILTFSFQLLFLFHYLYFVVPDPNQDWASEHSRKSMVTVDGNKVSITNVRNFRWDSATEYTEGFYDRDFNLDELESMYYIVATINGIEAVGHVFLSFGFSNGEAVSISVEGRRKRGIPYDFFASMFRQYQLIFAFGDERDVLGLRGAIWQKPVYFYPARATPEAMRTIFLDMLKRGDSLYEKPEFYHLLVNNCMTNIVDSLRRMGGVPVPHYLAVLLTGFSDRVAYRLGFIDTELSFEETRRVFRVDDWMKQDSLEEGFSVRLREELDRRLKSVREGDIK